MVQGSSRINLWGESAILIPWVEAFNYNLVSLLRGFGQAQSSRPGTPDSGACNPMTKVLITQGWLIQEHTKWRRGRQRVWEWGVLFWPLKSNMHSQSPRTYSPLLRTAAPHPLNKLGFSLPLYCIDIKKKHRTWSVILVSIHIYNESMVFPSSGPTLLRIIGSLCIIGVSFFFCFLFCLGRL